MGLVARSVTYDGWEHHVIVEGLAIVCDDNRRRFLRR